MAAGYASVPVKVPQGRFFINSYDGWIDSCESLEQWAEVAYHCPAVGVCCKKRRREPDKYAGAGLLGYFKYHGVRKRS